MLKVEIIKAWLLEENKEKVKGLCLCSNETPPGTRIEGSKPSSQRIIKWKYKYFIKMVTRHFLK